MITVDLDVLEAVAPHVVGQRERNQRAIIAALGEVIESTLLAYSIANRLRIAHFLAQICHESDGFCTTEEYASGAAYEGRVDLGNAEKGDGKRFKGRGLLQLTGRSNYALYGNALKIDLINAPEKAAEPDTSLRIACEFWVRHDLNGKADEDDLVSITKRINGGTNGIESRRIYLARAKAALVRLEGAAIASVNPISVPVLRRGSKGEPVATLQAHLRSAGFPLAIDADFGPATELAVMGFQQQKKLVVDGIVGPPTWSALGGAIDEPSTHKPPIAAAPVAL